jgi:hypothetical protein
MKKKNLKSLKLNKKSISNLRVTNIRGGNETATDCPAPNEDVKTTRYWYGETTVNFCPHACIYTVGPCSSLFVC